MGVKYACTQISRPWRLDPFVPTHNCLHFNLIDTRNSIVVCVDRAISFTAFNYTGHTRCSLWMPGRKETENKHFTRIRAMDSILFSFVHCLKSRERQKSDLYCSRLLRPAKSRNWNTMQSADCMNKQQEMKVSKERGHVFLIHLVNRPTQGLSNTTCVR